MLPPSPLQPGSRLFLHVVKFNVTLEGDCVSFGRVRRRQFRTRLVERLRRLNRTFVVFEDHVYLNVACGSVKLDASIVAPNAAAATQLQVDVQEQVLANSSLASEALGETVSAVGVAAVGEPLIIDAPSPPPTPPPSPEPASAAPLAPASDAPPAPVKPLGPSEDRQEQTSSGMDAETVWIILGSAVLLLILSAVCCGVYCGKLARRRSGSVKWSGMAAPNGGVQAQGGGAIPGRTHSTISFESLFDGSELVDPVPPPPASPGLDAHGERI